MEIQDKEKEWIIIQLCKDIINSCRNKTSTENQIYFDYDSVINLLTQTKEVIEESLLCPRPEEISKGIPWSERLYDGENDPDPYVFNGSMSIEDFERYQDLMLGEEENEI